MLVLFNNLLRDSIYGMVMRVSIGAFLSLLDAGTDMYVLISYYSAGLNTQANILLAMIVANMFVQCLIVLVVYAKKSWQRKLYEVVITVTVRRPPVDAYRVSTNQSDDELTINPLSEMVSDQRREPQPAHRSSQLIQNQTQPNPTQPSTYPDVQQGCRIRMREHPWLCVAVLGVPGKQRAGREIRGFVNFNFRAHDGLFLGNDRV